MTVTIPNWVTTDKTHLNLVNNQGYQLSRCRFLLQDNLHRIRVEYTKSHSTKERVWGCVSGTFCALACCFSCCRKKLYEMTCEKTLKKQKKTYRYYDVQVPPENNTGTLSTTMLFGSNGYDVFIRFESKMIEIFPKDNTARKQYQLQDSIPEGQDTRNYLIREGIRLAHSLPRKY